MSWYEQHIEDGVRDAVRLLRDNGFNTFNSCHHDMTIDLEFSLDGEAHRLHRLLSQTGEDYTLTHTVEVVNGWPHSVMKVEFPKRSKVPRVQ
jgi:hypothetical protein